MSINKTESKNKQQAQPPRLGTEDNQAVGGQAGIKAKNFYEARSQTPRPMMHSTHEGSPSSQTNSRLLQVSTDGIVEQTEYGNNLTGSGNNLTEVDGNNGNDADSSGLTIVLSGIDAGTRSPSMESDNGSKSS
jgi:hypothetical protein